MTFTLLGFCCFFLAAATSNVGAVDPIPEAEVEADMQAVGVAIGAPWVEMNPSGVHRMETKRESFRLTDAQRALFNRHWEMETIQTQKPTAPEQFNLAMLADALDMVVEMNMPERRVHLRLDKLDAWVAEGPKAEMADLQREEEELRRSEAGEGTEEAAKVPMPEASAVGQGEEMVAANNRTAALPEQAAEGGQPPPVEEEKAGELVHLIREDEEEEEDLAQCSEDEKPGKLLVADEARQNNTVAPGADGKPFMMIRVQRGGTERRAAGGGGVNFLFPSLMAEMEQQSGEIVEAEPEAQDAGSVLFVVEEEEEESGEEEKEDEAKLAEKKAEEAKQQEEKRREELKQQIADVLTKIEKVSTAAGNAGNVTSSEEDEKRIFQQIQVQRVGGGGGEEDVPSSANANAQPAILVVDFARENSAGSEEEQGGGLRVIQVKKLGQEDKTSTEEEEEKEAVEEKALEEKKKEEEKKEDKKKEVAEHKATEENNGTVGGLMGALSRLLLLNRGKREALAEEQQNQQEQEKQQIMESEMPKVAEEEEEAKKDDGEGNNNKKKLIMLRSFEGRMAVGANGVLGISTKMMMEMGVDKPMADKDGKEENDEKKTEEEDAEDAGDEKAKAAGEDVPNPASENQPPEAEEEQGNQEPMETAAAAVVQMAPENAAARAAGGGEVPSSATNGEQMPAGLLEIVRAEKEGLKRYFELLVIRAAPGPKRNEKLAYIWYSELQYWIAKRMETDFADVVAAARKDGGNVGELMDSVQAAKPQGIRAKEVDYLRMQWAKTVGRLAQLNDWIGKDFRRRRK